ncbi:MAG TPA: histidine phosphatase family protein [Usitatibacter sp.]|nr:histidine phosphatase family protein [Usitatibacter sp.]
MSHQTKIVLVRHGETRWNVERRIQGQGDSPLTDAGIGQARAIGRRLARERFDGLVSSDLGRAMQTASEIGALTGHDAVPDPRLRERHFGDGEGMTYTEIDARFPGAFSRVREVDPDYAIPGGESRRQLHQRVTSALEALAEEHRGQALVVVTHGGVLATLYRHVHGIDLSVPHSIPILNASYNALTHDGTAFRIDAWADIDHLPGGSAFEEN